jgi:exodeoxyribonuclease VII small subunit
MAKKDISYSRAIKEIEEILRKIESEELDVDQLSASVKKAADLLKICKSMLRDTEQEIQKILDDMDKDSS